MAICGFRADNYDFGLLEGAGLKQMVSFLQKTRAGLPLGEAEGEGNGSMVEALQRAGLVSLRDQTVFIAPQGEKLLDTFQSVLQSSE